MRTATVVLLDKDHNRLAELRVPVGKVQSAALVTWRGGHFVYTPQPGISCLYYVECDPPVGLDQEKVV